jgi:ATP-dependent Lon protease
MSDPQHPEKDAEILPSDHPHAPAKEAGSRAPAKPDEVLPTTLIALPLSQRPVFPAMMLPLVIPAGRLAVAVKRAVEAHQGYVGFFMTDTPLDDAATYTAAMLQPMGAIARIVKHQEVDSGALQVFAQVIARFRRTAVLASEPQVLIQGEAIRPVVDAGNPQVRSCAMAIVQALKDLVQHNPVFADEIKLVLANFNNLDGPSRLADMAASLTTAKRDELQQILETIPVQARMEKVLLLLAKESQLAQMKVKIQGQVEQKVGDNQRKFFLNEQLKAIKQELGLETDDKSLEVKRLSERFAAKRAAMSAETVQTTEEELRKLQLLDPNSAEYGVTRSRLEWLTDLPWGETSTEVQDLHALRAGLDADHFGLDEVKDRITEFVAVRVLKNDRGGGIIALVGPPGTGKTSIGASIAKHLGRKFFRFSLGGMRDEAEIKGHRRTYVGALPGKPVQALRRCGTMNPVILLDEIDKLAHSNHGDPSAALLEVLDPEQNRDFLDHYLDVRVDLSQVLFICTANDLGGIPEPLRDRMEIIRLAGYVELEKLTIAADHLVPKQRAAHGLKARDLTFTRPGLRQLVRDYAREAGVRHLEQLIAKVCRKVAKERALGGTTPHRVTPENLVTYLGKAMLRDEALVAEPVPGVVTGLAWTAMGGATLEIEAVATATDKGGLQLTGQLGDVMKESASLARSWLMAHGETLGVPKNWFEQHAVHLHVPAGATPKDGPSAGITMATALLSLALGKPVIKGLGMTGELTLTGRVYPIGGVREKLVAAKRSGLTSVLLPAANERDYDELPDLVKNGLTVRFVSRLDEVLTAAGLVAAAATSAPVAAKAAVSRPSRRRRPAAARRRSTRG